jgi:hypothetical protein
MITHLSDNTLGRMLRAKEAARHLLDYAPPGAVVSVQQVRALIERLDAGYTPADAAEAVQATTPWEPRQ